MPVTSDPRLAGPLTLEDVGDILADAGHPARPVLCGHDPDFSDLVTELVGAPIEIKKGALVRIDLDGADRAWRGHAPLAAPTEPVTGRLISSLAHSDHRGRRGQSLSQVAMSPAEGTRP